MSTIKKIAYSLGERGEVPNQILARELTETEDKDGIREVAYHLFDENQSIASDCIKVLYEIGYLKPELITTYVDDFIRLLDSKSNRMVWGAMIALSTIVPVVPQEIHPVLPKIRHHIETGTVITNVSGVRTIVRLAGADESYYAELIKEIFELQTSCRNTDFAKRAEDIIPILKEADKQPFKSVLEKRLPHLSKNAQKRVIRVIRKLS